MMQTSLNYGSLDVCDDGAKFQMYVHFSDKERTANGWHAIRGLACHRAIGFVYRSGNVRIR